MIEEQMETNLSWFKTRVFLLVALPFSGIALILQQILPAAFFNFLIGFAGCILVILLLSTILGIAVAGFIHKYCNSYEKDHK